MKRVLTLITAIALLGICTATAQYKKKVLTTNKITELNILLPVELTLVDSDKASVIVEIPEEVEQRIVYTIDHGELSIRYADKLADDPQTQKLLANNPVKLRVESSGMRCINNISQMRLTYKNRRLDYLEINNSGIVDWNDTRLEIGRLEINNAGVFRITANKITADTIEINNSGRYSCHVNTFYCENWEQNNCGVNDIESAVQAKMIECNSTGKEQLRLNVTCEQLEVNSTGVGSMTFSGTADAIDVSSTGLTRISTSAVNTRQ